MEAEIVSIGTELLLGEIVDTNAPFLAAHLAEIGINCHFRQTVGDNLGRMVEALKLAAGRADVVLTSGGLGLTADDITREALSELSGRRIEPDPAAPYSLRNPVGFAPGIWLEVGQVVFVSMPGVPAELRAMFVEEVLPRLRRRMAERGEEGVIVSRLVRFTGIAEAAMEAKVRDLVEAGTNPTLAPYVGTGECWLRITARAADRSAAEAMIAPVEAEVRRRLGEWVYGTDSDTLESVVGRLLVERGERLAVAESCTGGLVAGRITSVAGSSRYFERGYITYSNEAKKACLGVPESLLAAHGAVSEPVARAMAAGARKAAGVEWAVSTTGIAGPTGGTPEKPVGLVYIAVAGPDAHTVTCSQHLFRGDRQTVQQRAAAAALDALRRRLIGARDGRDRPGGSSGSTGRHGCPEE
ncbi:MAG TPA: nicotinamide-nucleotide amidohydrolase family protein [Firmicutes bacterium]|nr:nicotinamide-nucleotide amidohydrolase family protein [Bacillota bacterium]